MLLVRFVNVGDVFRAGSQLSELLEPAAISAFPEKLKGESPGKNENILPRKEINNKLPTKSKIQIRALALGPGLENSLPASTINPAER